MKMIKIITIYLLVFLDCSAKEVFSLTSGEVLFEVITEPNQPFWRGAGRSGPPAVCIRISTGRNVSVHYSKCGILCGVLMEGLAMRPDFKIVESVSKKEWSVVFNGKEDRIEIMIEGSKMVMTWDQASMFVDSLVSHWNKKSKK